MNLRIGLRKKLSLLMFVHKDAVLFRFRNIMTIAQCRKNIWRMTCFDQVLEVGRGAGTIFNLKARISLLRIQTYEG